ncbi:hypothetical protein B7P43_G16768 [Cryptotermes secundus]|uniref:PiggyBac transposable element-derived protein domain-containing protein n=1 Tax=Cryptotermes secundus TaxID=105785 RepID=A0A2J7PPH5_9NEOP|nr:hypothetical protein B7P43_G16768 [Cryptotermes secundus]
MGASSVQRWVKHFKDGNTSIEDEPQSDRPRTASTEATRKEWMISFKMKVSTWLRDKSSWKAAQALREEEICDLISDELSDLPTASSSDSEGSVSGSDRGPQNIVTRRESESDSESSDESASASIAGTATWGKVDKTPTLGKFIGDPGVRQMSSEPTKTEKGMKKVALWLINCALFNSFLVFKELNENSTLKYKAFLMNVTKAWARDLMVEAEPASDTDVVRPGPSTPTPRRPHVDPPGRLSGDMQKHTLVKIVMSEQSMGKYPSRQCRVCAVHKKRSKTSYICKFCVMPLHRGECFQKYHTLKHFYEIW